MELKIADLFLELIIEERLHDGAHSAESGALLAVLDYVEVVYLVFPSNAIQHVFVRLYAGVWGPALLVPKGEARLTFCSGKNKQPHY